jgi:hypothetical protein
LYTGEVLLAEYAAEEQRYHTEKQDIEQAARQV